ncbi:Bifunctional transcriptional activator/DNA repair enzyme Ada [Ephemeroptericola cinctiostellae]|uniref:methylated-DNA--[protein]-cysteine S-methyltransferase n=1 Tax=Ephemeroptericola cinctiostellae TaxID=2268024 RepID=A0A345D830_9BURK|nr:methylated-DNA--[protein]-cysteine S-methyltransferase [Ephemeroptericola cinctiostellae]AXF84518.1 Bifunctional transcriptional activator/DNA repair enzyme Ada [Ephemeroptericola cinctiostellae]
MDQHNNQFTHFDRVADAIAFIQAKLHDQPSLDAIAEHVGLSPYHFQRIFSEWAGTSPKKFLQFLSISYAKKLLKQPHTSIQDAAFETGLSGASRLHDLFIHIEGMTPGEYRNGGEGLTIHYSFARTLFGPLLVASTAKGICHMAFCTNEKAALTGLKHEFPNAHYLLMLDEFQQNALLIFNYTWHELHPIKLHLKGTSFQLKVWASLLNIPLGELASYGELAARIGQPKAARAVGSAIAHNPIAYLIPCHRVIQATGTLGNYRWEASRKAAMIGWELAHVQHADE